MSRTLDADSDAGIDVPPELLPSTELLEIVGNCANVAEPAKSVKLGCVELGTPAVEMVFIH